MGMQTLALSTQAEPAPRQYAGINTTSSSSPRAPRAVDPSLFPARVAWTSPVCPQKDPWPFQHFPLTIAGPVITHLGTLHAPRQPDVTVPQQVLPLGLQQHLHRSASEANRARPLGRTA
jgi:hypothetical protein